MKNSVKGQHVCVCVFYCSVCVIIDRLGQALKAGNECCYRNLDYLKESVHVRTTTAVARVYYNLLTIFNVCVRSSFNFFF